MKTKDAKKIDTAVAMIEEKDMALVVILEAKHPHTITLVITSTLGAEVIDDRRVVDMVKVVGIMNPVEEVTGVITDATVVVVKRTTAVKNSRAVMGLEEVTSRKAESEHFSWEVW